MSTLLAQMEYDFSAGSKPLLIGEGDDKKSAASFLDLQTSISSLGGSFSNVITQHNAALLEQENAIAESGVLSLQAVDGAATLTDVINAFNSLQASVQSALTNLNSAPK